MPPPGESRAAAWRMLMMCAIYIMTLAQSPEGATHGGCVINHECANGFNLVFICNYFTECTAAANPARNLARARLGQIF